LASFVVFLASWRPSWQPWLSWPLGGLLGNLGFLGLLAAFLAAYVAAAPLIVTLKQQKKES